MENFTEFDQQGTVPQRETGSIISHAFEMYKGMFGYALLAMLIYFAATWLVQMASGFDSQALVEEIQSGGKVDSTTIMQMDGLKTYYGFSGLLGILIAPLFVGLIYMANKVNNKVPVSFSDLFIGYKQNVVNILIYSLITSIIIGIAFALCFLPGLFVAPLFFIGYPILLFENDSAMEALKKSFNIAKENYGTFIGTALLSGIISIAGIIFCGIGIVLTFPFMYAAMYSAYTAFIGKPRQIIHNA